MSQKISQAKESKYESIIKPYSDMEKYLQYGIYFKQPKNELILFKQHLYSLFLLLFYHGEPEHKQFIIQEITKCKQWHQQFKKGKSKSVNKKIFAENFDFVLAELSQQPNKDFHSVDQRQSIRNTFKEILMFKNLLTYRSDLNFVQFAQLAGKLIGANCIVKDYLDFQIVQFEHSCFQKKKKDVFIEINKKLQRYSYVKRIRNIKIILNERKNTNQETKNLDLKKICQQTGINLSQNEKEGFMFTNLLKRAKTIEQTVVVEVECSSDDDFDEVSKCQQSNSDQNKNQTGQESQLNSQNLVNYKSSNQQQAKTMLQSQAKPINVDFEQKQTQTQRQKKNVIDLLNRITIYQILTNSFEESEFLDSKRELLEKIKQFRYNVEMLDQSFKQVVKQTQTKQESLIKQNQRTPPQTQKKLKNLIFDTLINFLNQKQNSKEIISSQNRESQKIGDAQTIHLDLQNQIIEKKQMSKNAQTPISEKQQIRQTQNIESEKNLQKTKKVKTIENSENAFKKSNLGQSPGKIVKNSRIRYEEKASKSAYHENRKYQYPVTERQSSSKKQHKTSSLPKYDEFSYSTYRRIYNYDSMYEKWKNYDEAIVQNYIRKEHQLCKVLEQQKKMLLNQNYNHFSIRPSQAMKRRNRWGINL